MMPVKVLSAYRPAGGMKYFEVGNEDWHGDHWSIKRVLPEEYGIRYLGCYSAMMSVDLHIRIVVNLHTSE